MRTALKAQDANTARRNINVNSKQSHMSAAAMGVNQPQPQPNPSGFMAGNPGNPASHSVNAISRPDYAQTAAYIDDERDSMRAWRARWRQIMQTAVIYFDGIPQPQVDKLKSYLAVLNSTTQPFYDQKVTHVISENQHNELATKARDHGCKVYTVQKLSRFLGSLLGRSLTTAVDNGQSSRLAQLLEDDSRMSSMAAHSRRDDFVSFRGPYLLVYDAQGYHRPLHIKEWRAVHDLDDSEWPQLRRVPMGVSPFTAKSAIKVDKRKYHDQQIQIHNQQIHNQQIHNQQIHNQHVRQQQQQQQEDGEEHEQPDEQEYNRLHKVIEEEDKENGEEAEEHLRQLQPQQPLALENSVIKRTKEPGAKRRHILPSMDTAEKENYMPLQSGQSLPMTYASRNQSQNSQPSQPQQPTIRPIPAQSTNSTRLRDFGEIVASGVPRYSQTSTKSFSARDGVASREMANLRRKVTGSQVVSVRNASLTDTSTSSRIAQRPQAKTKSVSKKPGYCENCLERYDDLQEHLGSKTHQQFAGNESKFVGLDEIISRLQRPRSDEALPSDNLTDNLLSSNTQ